MDLLTPAVVGFGTLGALSIIVPTIAQALKMQPYLYASTRCSARSGFILSKENYNEMVQVTYAKELFSLMETTPYKEIFEKNETFEGISSELDKDLFNTYSWFGEVVPKEIKKLVEVMKARFEIMEIKRILNSLRIGQEITEPEFIDDYYYKLKLKEVRSFQDLANASDGRFYSDVFGDKGTDEIAEVMTLLDKAWLMEVLSEIGKTGKEQEAFREYWTVMIDLFNVRLAIRKEGDGEIGFIKGGYIPAKDLDSVDDLDQLESVIEKTRYKEFFSKESYTKMELGFFKYLRKLGKELNSKYTLTVGPIINYMIEKELEIKNVNVLVKLKMDNLSKEEIEGLVI